MPRASKNDKFFYQAPKKTGAQKGQVLLATNVRCRKDEGKATLQEFYDFVKEIGIDPAKVELPSFALWVKP
jgi:hypothetical protein